MVLSAPAVTIMPEDSWIALHTAAECPVMVRRVVLSFTDQTLAVVSQEELTNVAG